MQWSGQQEAALEKLQQWWKRKDEQVFRLFGYAGTGKTTLARHIADSVKGEVCFAAFTGKAAHVLERMGCDNASTLHQLMYLPAGNGKAHIEKIREEIKGLEPEEVGKRKELEKQIEELQQPRFVVNDNSALHDASLVIVDECSMVGKRLGQDLMSFGIPVLAMGDPGQLPPVGDAAFFSPKDPDITLTEIHRQAADNPIIQMATMVRMGQPLEYGNYGDSRVIKACDLQREDAMNHDQILVGRNATRHSVNDRARFLIHGKIHTMPVHGDRLICLQNNHKKGLKNGAIWYSERCEEYGDTHYLMTVNCDETGRQMTCLVDAHELMRLEGKREWQKDVECFDYGYAITVHKAQGSQWDNVLIFDESHAFREDAAKHLYTALTRAAQRVTVVK